MPMSSAEREPSPASSESMESLVKTRWQANFNDGNEERAPLMSRLWRSITTLGRGGNYSHDYYSAPSYDNDDSGDSLHLTKPRRRRGLTYSGLLHWFKWFLYRSPLFALMFFGAIHLIVVLYGKKALWLDTDKPDELMSDWATDPERLAHYSTDATRDVLPIPCHSHNDYWRRIPLFDALHWGCTSVEADVWLYDDKDVLLVGHSAASLTPTRTFRSLYVDPLVEMLDRMNPDTDFGTTKGHGVFDVDPDQTLVLLVDFKTSGRDLFPIVQEQLEPLREKGHLSHWNGQDFVSGAITVVGTGNTPFDMITENQSYRDIFFDAPLDEMYEPASPASTEASSPPLSNKATRGQGKSGTGSFDASSFNYTNSYYASVSMFADIGLPWTGVITAHHLEIIRGQIRGAKRRGLKARYWETPAWPTSLRNHVWKVLIEEGAEMLNVDDLQAAASLNWEQVGHNWIDG